MVYFVAVLVVVAAVLAYKFYTSNKASATVSQVSGGVSAFAKVAEAEGKLIALKAVTAVKTEEAKLAHAALDELNKLLG